MLELELWRGRWLGDLLLAEIRKEIQVKMLRKMA